jgi:predicted RNase H-like nuclease
MPPGRFLLAATQPLEARPPRAKEVFQRVQALVEERRQELEDRDRAETDAVEIRGYSQQASGILLKVAEVDAFLAAKDTAGEGAARREWLIEVHPEMCFMAMNESEPLPPKTSGRGQLQRLDLVAGAFPDADRRIRSWSGATRYSLLDICDAYAALWTALRWRRHDAGLPRDELDPPLEVLGETEPGASATDPETGLPMRMVV